MGHIPSDVQWLAPRTSCKEKRTLCDTIAVAEQYRGLGIGSKLLQTVIDFGRKENFACVKLSVIGTNTHAKKLYERTGFREESVQKIPYPWSRTFGFEYAIDMILEL